MMTSPKTRSLKKKSDPPGAGPNFAEAMMGK